ATPGRVVPYRHRVIYGDTDQMGVVYYGNYLRFFEAARGDWIRNLGMTYAQIEERGIFLPVLEVGVRYLKPARYDDLLEIPLKVSHTRVKVRFDYKVYRADEPDVLLLGHTVHACVTKEGRPTRAPDWLVERMAGAATSGPTLPEGYDP
ncbi:MAG TPA: thioesterase family protein, partial [Myxococcales bacterium]|nr:thioesterase family protein [Myxococcales bacterium]